MTDHPHATGNAQASSSISPVTVMIGDAPVTCQDVVAVARHGAAVALTDAALLRIDTARSIVERIIADGQRAYGINTGLGALCNVVLNEHDLARLSRNTIQSHACGVGTLLPVEQVRAIMCSAVINYSHGKSGISRAAVETLVSFLNLGITPEVPSQGSVGYLTHMAHIGLPLVGQGFVEYQGQRMASARIWEEGILPLPELGAKDGLSLVNGTLCMTGLSCLAIDDARGLLDWADVTGAMSFEALGGQVRAFAPEVLEAKFHPGASEVGKRLRALLGQSENILRKTGTRTQDALSLRAIPQVHGAARDQLAHVTAQVERELRGVSDNPIILGTLEQYEVISQANPHGESVSMAADLLAVAMAEVGSIAERRLDRLVNPLVSNLPAFLIAESGVNSGFMITQYVAASLCADNRRLAMPAVTDNYVTSALQEDHLSMGTSAALKALQVADNLRRILAIEWLAAAQAFEFLPDSKGEGTARAHGFLREWIPAYHEDRWLSPDIEQAATLMRTHGAGRVTGF
ncbi:HAL/PAL/TAL family ammonia-lyase [Pokkaliibacter sp. CJK22405]|uniref:HAL/PAL/TAL family ammonia-lyase n=1 Tax=Pokkaliibacter sp. CJK22405 TaxID=3384615 RepID=UPI00398541CD